MLMQEGLGKQLGSAGRARALQSGWQWHTSEPHPLCHQPNISSCGVGLLPVFFATICRVTRAVQLILNQSFSIVIEGYNTTGINFVICKGLENICTVWGYDEKISWP